MKTLSLLLIGICCSVSPAVDSFDTGIFYHPKHKIEMVDESEVTCLADNMYFEASGESEEGKVAVALVTLNRTKTRHHDICHIVYEQYRTRHGKIICQFSWTCQKNVQQVNEKVMNRCFEIASILLTLPRLDTTHKATHFHTISIHPFWSLGRKPVARIGHHVFYHLE